MAKTKVRCDNCKQENTLGQLLRERFLPDPYQDVVEGLLICPDCGKEVHCYYMSREARLKSVEILEKIGLLQASTLQADYEKLKFYREEIHKIYDDEQQLYQQIMEKVAVKDGGD
jgi:hypothetical protein